MSNKLLRTYILLAVAICSKASFAQTRLQFGLEDHSALVKTPYIHWDLLRTMNPEWIREDRSTPTAPWEPLNRLFNEQDAAGRFTLLQYQVWSIGTGDWVDDNKNTYFYTLDANSRVSEIQKTEINQFYTNSRTEYYEYNTSGDILKEAFEINGNIGFEAHFSYNSQGLRVVDSTFGFPGGNMTHNGLKHYEYDASNRCTKQTNVYNINNSWDTLGHTLYTWQGSNLTSIESHSITQLGSPVIPFNRIDYTYDNGRLVDAVISQYDTSTLSFVPVWFCKHYYTNNLITAMVSGDDTGNGLQNTDSITLTYLTNGNLDTGYQFAALGNGSWETAARFRLLFRRINTGIAAVPPVINAVNVYPNPVTEQLSIDVELVNDGNISLQVTDMNGRTVKTINAVNMPAGKNTIKVSALDMQPGIYFITCGNNSVKLVKE